MDDYFRLRKPILNNPTDLIMSAGGDDRILISERSGLNKYGCTPYPQNVIAYASSTASTISSAAYSIVEARHHALMTMSNSQNEKQVYKQAFDEIRERLKKCYGISDEIDIAFGASGTDLEIAVLAMALSAGEGKVHNIIVAPEEVGSGTEYVARGQYFSDHTALGKSVAKGDQIEGFKETDISVSMVEVREYDGTPILEELIISHIESEIQYALDIKARTILHVVHRSKTGLIVPTWRAIQKLIGRYGQQIDVIVDACQGRISPKSIQDYLGCNCVVIITGSKFFGGAPFSGALFVPKNIAQRVKGKIHLPKGLGDFFTRNEWPEDWASADLVLPNEMNYGLLLRWESALYEMERLLAISNESISKAIQYFQESVLNMVKRTNILSMDATSDSMTMDMYHHPFEKNMIMTLILEATNPITNKKFDIDDAKYIHKGLYTDISFLLPENILNNYANIIIHLGQPVKYVKFDNEHWTATLRIALGAPLISDIAMLNEALIKNRFDSDMNRFLQKMHLLVEHFDLLKKL